MKPAGIIITYIDWRKWKKWWLNIPLFLWQLTFLIVGTVYGKIKWPKLDRIQDRAIGVILTWILMPLAWFIPRWWNAPMIIITVFVGIATFRYIDWRRVWRAAQACHVRLVLEEPNSNHFLHWLTANFGYPTMEIQPWREKWNDGTRFEYREPTFDPSPEFIAAMIQYAHDQVGKQYDDFQLGSCALNLLIWICWPPSWGKEVNRWLNRKGAREHCSSGVTACLRWLYSPKGVDNVLLICITGANAGQSRTGNLSLVNNVFFPHIPFENNPTPGDLYSIQDPITREYYSHCKDVDLRQERDFFPRYHTAMVSPCLMPLSKNWRGR